MQVTLLLIILFILLDPEEKTLWKAQILDAESGKPLSSVHVRSPRAQTISDRNGYFEIGVEELAKVTISHVGYETLVFYDTPDALPKTIFLKPLVIQLDQIEVRPYPSEGEFKKEVLDNPYIPPLMEQNLTSNLTNMKAIYKLAYAYDMTSYNVFLERARPNGGVTILTSSGGGLIQAFKPLKRPSNPSFPSTVKSLLRLNPDLIQKLSLPDSLKMIKKYF